MRIYVISAYPAVRAGLAALVRDQSGWQVVGESSPDLASHQESGWGPSLVGDTEVILADLDGVAAMAQVEAWLAALSPSRGIVVLGGHAGSTLRERRGGAAYRLLPAIARGAGERNLAFGALRRDASAEEISAALVAVESGLFTFDPLLLDALYVPVDQASALTTSSAEDEGEQLTARELEVLQLLAQGLPNKLIAQRLHISDHTAKFHVSAILMKLGAASRTEAVTTAARRGLLLL